MRYTLLVLTPPDAGASARHALHFATALLAQGEELACVFFFDAAVLTAQPYASAPADEDDLRAAWRTLQSDHGARLLACSASAERFGVADACTETQGTFQLGGLGDLVEASQSSDRLLTFRG